MKKFGNPSRRRDEAKKRVRFRESLSGDPHPERRTNPSHSTPVLSRIPDVPQPGPVRHGSMPTLLRGHGSRLRAREALDDMQRYLMEACNFQGTHLKLAMSALNVATLSSLVRYVNELRGVDSHVSQRDELMIRSYVDPYTRHPHYVLTDDSAYLEHCPKYERCARIAHKYRQQREAEHHLSMFVSRQLGINLALLDEMSSEEGSMKEIDALRERIFTFNQPGVATANNALGSAGVHSLPGSPAQHPSIVLRSPQSVPIEAMRRGVANLAQAINSLEQEMGELILPGSSYEAGPSSSSAATLRRTNTAPYATESPSVLSTIQGTPVQVVSSPYAQPLLPSTTLLTPAFGGSPMVQMTHQVGHILPTRVESASTMPPAAGTTFIPSQSGFYSPSVVLGFGSPGAAQYQTHMGTGTGGAPHTIHEMGVPHTPATSLGRGGSVLYPGNDTPDVYNAYGASPGFATRGNTRSTAFMNNPQRGGHTGPLPPLPTSVGQRRFERADGKG